MGKESFIVKKLKPGKAQVMAAIQLEITVWDLARGSKRSH